MKRNNVNKTYVVGHIEGTRTCELPAPKSDILAFYRKSGITYIAFLGFNEANEPVYSEKQTVTSLGMVNFSDKVYCHSKRFMHNVQMFNGTIVNRELYLVAMSLKLIPLSNYSGWSSFVTANPTFGLVTAVGETEIPYTSQLIDDLVRVNTLVNSYPQLSDGSLDNWKILGPGEAGDCEDFALTKADMLLKLGYPATALHIGIGKTLNGLGHAWLEVCTSGTTLALDNNLNTALSASSLSYTDRQRQIGPLWKSMSIFDSFKNAVHAGYSEMQPLVWWYIYDPMIAKFTGLFGSTQRLPYLNTPTNGGFEMSGDTPIYGPDKWVSNNCCNFSADDAVIYVSQTVMINNFPIAFAYAFRYEEKLSTVMGHTTIKSYNKNDIIFIDRNGDVYYTIWNSGDIWVYNLHTGTDQSAGAVNPDWLWTAGVNNWGPYGGSTWSKGARGLQIASPDGYFSQQPIRFDETNTLHNPWDTTGIITSTSKGVTHFSPANGSYDVTFVTTPPPEVTTTTFLWSNPYKRKGLFTKDFTTYFTDHGNGNVSGTTTNPSYIVEYTIKTPFGEEISCGTGTYSGTFYPANYRKWPLPWFHGQGEEDLLQGFLLSTVLYSNDNFVESDRRLYKNGIRIDETLISVAGIEAKDLLGLVYTP